MFPVDIHLVRDKAVDLWPNRAWNLHVEFVAQNDAKHLRNVVDMFSEDSEERANNVEEDIFEIFIFGWISCHVSKVTADLYL